MGRSITIVGFIFFVVFFSCSKKRLEPLEPIEKNCVEYVHRVNTLEKTQAALTKFEGIETDVFYSDEKNLFLIKHEEKKYSNLKLVELLEYLQDYPNAKLWLDFKNLSDISVSNAVKRLVELDQKYTIKSRVFFESWNYRRLKSIQEAGFKTCCWTPNFNAGDDTMSVVNSINKILTNHQFNAISNEISMFEIFNKYFPEYPHHYWIESGKYEDEAALIDKICTSPSTKIILINQTY